MTKKHSKLIVFNENDKLKEGVEVAALAALDAGRYFLYNSHQWAAIELPF